MKLKNLLFIIGIVMATALFTGCGFERIDAGYDGIQVNKYGDEKGVDQIVKVTGAVWYNPIREDIYEVPTFMQDYNYENLEFKTIDKMTTTVSMGVQVSLPSGQTPALFVKYRNYFDNGGVDLSEIIYKHVRQAFSNVIGRYKAEELIINKEQFAIAAEAEVQKTLGELGFVVEGVFLLKDPTLPAAIQDQADAQVEANLIAQKKESELRQKEADARKLVVEAQGIADAAIIQAKADAEVYLLQTRNLSAAILQKMYIEKWNGDYGTGNVYGAGTNIMKNLK